MSRFGFLAAPVLAIAALLPMSAHAEHWSKSFVVDWLEPAFYYGGPENDFLAPGSDCAAGMANRPDMMKVLQTSWRDPKVLDFYKDAENAGDLKRILRWRGPNYEDVWANPELAPDYGGLPPVNGTVGFGFNLDGKVKAQDFTTPDGAKGIDNNYYRAAGCWMSYRGAAYNSERPLSNNGHMRDGMYTILMVISGDQSPTQDDNATLAFYQSKDRIIKDANHEVSPDASFAVEPSLRNQSVLKVKVHNGVVETALPQDIRMRDEAWNMSSPDQLQLTGGQLRFDLKPGGGFEGYFGGYREWKILYRRQAVSARDTETLRGIDLPSFYYALKRHADGDPDPATGQNRRISVAYRLRGVPAFVLTPNYGETVQTAQVFDNAPAAKLAQGKVEAVR
jgi:hypothetical protein